MTGEVVVAAAYLPVIFLCVVQFLRPTRLGWFALAAVFLAYAVAVLCKWRELTGLDIIAALLVVGVPALALLWSPPRGIERISQS